MTAQAERAAPTAEATARRVEELLERLSAAGGPPVAGAADELVRALMDFYGGGLARIVALLSGRSGGPLESLLDDEPVAGLLVLHDLHPDDVAGRVRRALRAADAGDMEVAALDAAAGTLLLRQPEGAAASGCGCGGGADAVRERVAAALACFAPEVERVDLEQAPAAPVLLQIGTRPPGPHPAAAR